MKKTLDKIADRWASIMFGGMLLGGGYILAKKGVEILNNGVL